ncbi:MAG: hypothetical protein C0490_09355, partial [Marivirga sp.]|nr:hypothetical protein [Marivirga sp.]
MKSVWKYLTFHIKEDFNARSYVLIFIFLAFSIFINYRFHFNDRLLTSQTGVTKYVHYFIFFSVAYYGALLIIAFSRKDNRLFIGKEFWVKSLFAVCVLSLDSSLPFLRDWIYNTFHSELQYWAHKVGVNLVSFFTVLLPLLIFHTVYERNEKTRYGLNSRTFDAKPYLQMLMIMLPILVAASFHSSFLRQYPMYKVTSAHVFLGVPEWVTVMCYEMAYGLDFVTVEFLFRGFMVIGMSSILGRNAVLAMAVAYCFLHFGKPPGEAISSVVGGYILGVIAFETKSIWGGVIVHMGIAWM